MPKKYYEDLIDEAGLAGCKPALAPAAADTKPSNLRDKESWEEPLTKDKHFQIRRLVGKLRSWSPSGRTWAWRS